VSGYGEFGAMCETELAFGARTARRLMSIVKDPRLADRAHAHVLPNSWMTIYELTKVDDDTFAQAIEDGTINPKMERKAV